MFNYSPSRRRLLCVSIKAGVVTLAGLASGCGSILYPERIGQKRRGALDWKIIALDGIFLVLFILPGAVAFAVDWYNGTLFVPNYDYSENGDEKFREVPLSQRKPTREEIEAALLKETGQIIDLEGENYYTRELNSLDEFDSAYQEALALYERGELVFRCQSPSTGAAEPTISKSLKASQ